MRHLIIGVALMLAGCERSSSSATTAAAPVSATEERLQAGASDPPPVAGSPPEAARNLAPLSIAYSDWPTWLAWEVGVAQGWFGQADVAVRFEALDYVSSLEAFAEGDFDGVATTNADALATASLGYPTVGVLINGTRSAGVVVRSGVAGISSLEGKTIGAEIGFGSHFALSEALLHLGLSQANVRMVDVPQARASAALREGDVDALALWRPHATAVLERAAGFKYLAASSGNGARVYDLLCVSPASLRERRQDWLKVVQVWMRIAAFVNDENSRAEATTIVSRRTVASPRGHQWLDGVTIFGLDDNVRHFTGGEANASLPHSTRRADTFHVAHRVYANRMPVGDYLDGSLVGEVARTAAGNKTQPP